MQITSVCDEDELQVRSTTTPFARAWPEVRSHVSSISPANLCRLSNLPLKRASFLLCLVSKAIFLARVVLTSRGCGRGLFTVLFARGRETHPRNFCKVTSSTIVSWTGLQRNTCKELVCHFFNYCFLDWFAEKHIQGTSAKLLLQLLFLGLVCRETHARNFCKVVCD
ncbi:hypothetical protein BRADI_5g10793v3 [Brachypodium distachyon]|uniref:Uncharacterized protein n=1 Tax=Brachypodium distachyon TaxID=15368 RepID=A0A2K2CGI3_BRADI|nr:hypothetical protein BRADI_5g10793v3 [Brachypodium distachyon]